MHLLRRSALAVIAAPALVGGCDSPIRPATPSSQTDAPSAQSSLTISNPGKWAPVPSWPRLVASHMAVLPDGRVFTFNSSDVPGTAETKDVYTWDPHAETYHQFSNGSNNVFCSGHSFLPDGRLVVAGGHIATGQGIKAVNFFDFRTSAWERGANLDAGRWYPTVTTLGNGEVLVVAGTNEVGAQNSVPEIGNGASWRLLGGAVRNLPYYPQMHLAHDGRVFMAGPSQGTRYINPAGSGAWSASVPSLWGLRSYGTSVMYAPGKILLVGGGDPPTATAEVIDLHAGTGWRSTGAMAYARRQHNGTVLPDGTVLVTGGTKGAGFNNEAQGVLAAELWNPATGTWTLLASMTTHRNYHSTAALLPDGRVISAGGGRCSGCTVDYPNAEIFSPPYLFNADGSDAARPTIAAAPAEVSHGQTFAVVTPDAANVARVTLIRLSSVTHAFNQNQRFEELSFTADADAGTLSVASPTSGNIAPAGHYMLFILNGKGVPSVARIVQVVGSAPLPAPSGSSDTTGGVEVDAGPARTGIEGDRLTFTGAANEDDGDTLTFTWNFGDGAPAATGSTVSHVYADDGNYTATLTVRDTRGGVATDVAPVTIANALPVVTVGTAPPSASAGQPYALGAGSFSDAGANDAPWSHQVDWGDGTPVVAADVMARGALPAASHTYATAGSYTITRRVVDRSGGAGSASATVTVTRSGTSAPTAVIGGSPAGQEGSAIAFSAAGSSDPDGGALTYAWNFGDGASASGASASHAYADNGSYPVTLTVTDPQGLAHSASATAAVANAAPVPNAGSDTTIVAGRRFDQRGSFSDAGAADGSWRFTYSWGDGTSSHSADDATAGSVPLIAHTYMTAGSRTLRLSVRDKDGDLGTDERVVTVLPNQLPVAAANGPYAAAEGTLVAFSSAGTSDGNGDALTYKWSFGDGSSSTTASPKKAYADNGTYAVTLVVRDPSGGADTATSSAVISNAAPTATLTAPTSIIEGASYTVSISGTDAGTADRATLQYALDCGLGAGYSAYSATVRSVTCPVQPDERAAVTVRGKVRDKELAERLYSRTMSVTNATPAVSLSAASAVSFPRGGTLSVRTRFTDAGVNDAPWAYTLVWGDGSPNTAGTSTSQGVETTFGHVYPVAGTFTAYVTVTDVDGRVGRSVNLTVTVTP